jgi:hypothetical protein
LIIAVAAAGGKRFMAVGCATGIYVGVRGDTSMSPLDIIIAGLLMVALRIPQDIVVRQSFFNHSFARVQ